MIQIQNKKDLIEKPETEIIRPRLFVDMDGTLAEWRNVIITIKKQEDANHDYMMKKLNQLLYTPHYFESLRPYKEVVKAIQLIVKMNIPEVFIMSCYIEDIEGVSPLQQKNNWTDYNIPEINQEHRIFVPNGKNKADYVPGGIRSTDYLLDDFTKNLNAFSTKGNGIKLLNPINSSHGTWDGPSVSYDCPAEELAKDICKIIQGDYIIHKQPEKDRTPLLPEDVIDDLGLGNEAEL